MNFRNQTSGIYFSLKFHTPLQFNVFYKKKKILTPPHDQLVKQLIESQSLKLRSWSLYIAHIKAFS